MGEATKRVLPASLIYTDEWKPYENLRKAGYTHRRIHHRSKVYVSGDIHTNTIEGFFSLVKNSIRGVYHSVSRKHLQGYLNEYAWRYNNRAGTSTRSQFELLLPPAPPAGAESLPTFATFLRLAKNSLRLGTGTSSPVSVRSVGRLSSAIRTPI